MNTKKRGPGHSLSRLTSEETSQDLCKRLPNSEVSWTVFPQGLQIFGQEKKTFAHASVLLASFLYLSVLHEILKFVVSAQTQHFLAAAGRIPGPQRRLNDEEERLEFIGFRAG